VLSYNMKYNDNVMVEIEPGGNNDVEHGKGMMVMGEGVLELNKVSIFFCSDCGISFVFVNF